MCIVVMVMVFIVRGVGGGGTSALFLSLTESLAHTHTPRPVLFLPLPFHSRFLRHALSLFTDSENGCARKGYIPSFSFAPLISLPLSSTHPDAIHGSFSSSINTSHCSSSSLFSSFFLAVRFRLPLFPYTSRPGRAGRRVSPSTHTHTTAHVSSFLPSFLPLSILPSLLSSP